MEAPVLNPGHGLGRNVGRLDEHGIKNFSPPTVFLFFDSFSSFFFSLFVIQDRYR